MSLVGVDLNTTLAQRKERRAASVPKSRPQSARAPRSSSPSVYAQRSGSRSQRGPRQPPRMEEPLLEAVAAVEAAQADAAPPPAPRPKPFADTPSRLFEGTKSQTRRVVELTRERQPSPQKRSSSAGPRRPRSAQIPTPARLPNPLQRHVNPPPPRALQSLSGGDVDAVIPMNGNERRQLTVTKSPSGRSELPSPIATATRALSRASTPSSIILCSVDQSPSPSFSHPDRHTNTSPPDT
jgi:hypothetical protein